MPTMQGKIMERTTGETKGAIKGDDVASVSISMDGTSLERKRSHLQSRKRPPLRVLTFMKCARVLSTVKKIYIL